MNQNASEHCTHCKEKIVIPVPLVIGDIEHHFCCYGCKTVFELLQENDLTEYYRLRETSGKQSFSPILETKSKYSYLDDPEFIQKYATQTEQTIGLTFYLEGIHCLACLWLIEKLPEINKTVLEAKLNMSSSTVKITIMKGSPLADIAKMLEVLGYPPHPIMESSDVESLRHKEDHKMLIKIAVAFFGAGNIMLLAFSVYAGASGVVKTYFEWISALMSLPVMFFSAIPFYKSAWNSLKKRQISIDFPIVVALILGSIFSSYSLINETGHIYFDTLTILVFLLLSSRYLLKKAQQKGLNAAEVSNFFSNIVTTKIVNGIKEEVFAKFLKIKDTVLIEAGDTIPADGIILKGFSTINSSLITGEAVPQKAKQGDSVFSGTVNLSSELLIEITKLAADSKLGVILKSVEKGWNQKAQIVNFADSIAKYFVSAIFLISTIVFIYFTFNGRYEDAFTRALTLIIITCPCALGLTTPLSLTLNLSRLAKKGSIVKDESVIEKLSKASTLLLDKTGTLTYGRFKITEWVNLDKQSNYDSIIYALEKKSQHPIGKAIISYLHDKYKNSDGTLTEIELIDYEETLGRGPSASFDSENYSIKATQSSQTLAQTTIALFKRDQEVVRISLSDELRENAKDEIQKIKEMGIEPIIISGDNSFAVNDAAAKLGIPLTHAFSGQTPEMKKEFAKKYPKAIMVGDGANDAIALSHAWVGIAVHGSVDISLRASSVFLSNSGLENITALIISSRETLKVIKRNLYFSLLYNIAGSILAMNGHISPLIAAILMPISSFVVLGSTLISTSKLREALKTS